jgi:pimeloyl-ACP methyl ester carboxylesterase
MTGMSAFDRRDFLKKTAIAIAALQVGLPTPILAQSPNTPNRQQALTFGSLKERMTMTTPLPPELTPEFSHQTANVNGFQMHYVIGGQGLPVVLLHGWPESWYEWRKIMPALAQTNTVIAPDMRGLGDSEKTDAGYDATTLADDVYALVQSLGFSQIVLVGHDLAVSSAYAYAAKYRDAVQRLAILDVPLEGFGREDFEAKRGIWWFGLFQAANGLAETVLEGHETALLNWFFSRAPAAFTQADIEEYVRVYSGRDALRAGFEYYRAFPTNAKQFQEYAKQKLTIPVLGIGGANGGAGWPFYSLAQVAEHPSAGIIPQCGHYIAEEQPDELLRQLSNFLRG